MKIFSICSILDLNSIVRGFIYQLSEVPILAYESHVINKYPDLHVTLEGCLEL